MKKRGVLSLWKTLMLVFVGINGIAGVTVLVIYLRGGFDGEVVPPDDIKIEQVVDGQGLYNSDLERLEVSSDFKMTISTATEGVTEKDVLLQLKGGTLKNGYWSDSVISVPYKVQLNTPFDVTLVKKDGWIA